MPANTIMTPTTLETVFSNAAFRSHEQVVFNCDPESGLRAIIAVHSTVLGPALGGTRFYPYPSESHALVDVLRLSEGMSYKAALAGLDLGGGKAVIIGDPQLVRSDALLRAFGRFVDRLGGRYVTAEDVGTTESDMDVIASETSHVTGLSASRSGQGDPSPSTALGVFVAMQAVAGLWDRTGSLDGLRVAIAGVGKVGGGLARRLAAAGAVLTLADVDSLGVKTIAAEIGAEVVSPDEIHRAECDIYSPCALGAGLNAGTIPELRCRAVVGAANNQLADKRSGEQLADRGIVYVPDFVANAGGLIHVGAELLGDTHTVEDRVRRIHDTVLEVLLAAELSDVTTDEAAVDLALRRIRSGQPDRSTVPA